MTIYELTEEMQQLLLMLEDPEMDPEMINDTLEAVAGEFADKADGYGRVRQELLRRIEGLKAEEARLAEYRRRVEKNVESLEAALKGAMEATGQKKIQTELFTFSVKATPPKVVVTNAEMVPFDYLKVAEPTVDKVALKTFLKDHEVDWAHLESGTALSIK